MLSRSEYYAMRIRHFLTGYRKKNNLTQSELASRVNSTKSTVSRIENDQDKHITQVLNILESLGNLEKMDLGSFLLYLEGKNSSLDPHHLFPWQKTVIESFSKLKQSLRLDLVTELMSLETAKLEQLFALLIQIQRLPSSSQELISRLVSELHH